MTDKEIAFCLSVVWFVLKKIRFWLRQQQPETRGKRLTHPVPPVRVSHRAAAQMLPSFTMTSLILGIALPATFFLACLAGLELDGVALEEI
jgi:hypothetical protein